MTTTPKASDFIVSSDPTRYELEIGLVVWVSPLTWIQQQEALSRFVDFVMEDDNEMRPKIDFGGYWRYILMKCVTRTEPELTQTDLLNLRPEVGAAISEVLPGITDLIATIGGESSPLV